MKRPKPYARLKRFIHDVYTHTPITRMIILMIGLWLFFSLALFLSEHGNPSATIDSYTEALYWGVAAFSTAGIADTPASQLSLVIGGLWIVIGSVIFFGTIVATVTSYFMRPMQRPHRKIIDTIEYNLEQLDDLNIDELDLLKETIDTLIEHVEQLKQKQLTK